MNFVFAGTPDFSARVLRHLDERGRRPALVISQPNRPRGRGRKTAPPPAVAEAERLRIDALQVEDLSLPEIADRIASTGVQTLVVAAFGQILRPSLLDRFLCLNVHASLLPAYRGAAPIERALAAGEERVGVSIMRMTPGLDEGPWALQTTLSVGLHDDTGSLEHALALLGALGIDQVLTGMADGTVCWRDQGHGVSYAHKLSVADTFLDTSLSARALHDHVRALSPHVGVRTHSGEVEFKIWRTWPYGSPGLDAVPPPGASVADTPGRLATSAGRLFLGCSQGVVELLLVQPAGKARMRVADFLRGYGTRLGAGVDPPTGTAGTVSA